jgi:hypothetical protein
MVKIMTSNVCSAFEAAPVGSKVTDATRFLDEVGRAVEGHAFPDGSEEGTAAGQAYIVMHDGEDVVNEPVLDLVSSGEGRRTADPGDYVNVSHRGRVCQFLRRPRAAKAVALAVVVYTAEAYLADPDVQGEPEEAARVRGLGATHVLVAVLASAVVRAPLSPERFAANLAGGNREALAWSKDRIHEEAARVAAHADEWCPVAG